MDTFDNIELIEAISEWKMEIYYLEKNVCVLNYKCSNIFLIVYVTKWIYIFMYNIIEGRVKIFPLLLWVNEITEFPYN